MQIKKYVAATLKEATAKMKAEFGDAALVLGTRIVEGGNERSGRRFELTVGIDYDLESENVPAAKLLPQKEIRKPKNFADELRNLSEKIYYTSSPPANNSGKGIKRNDKSLPVEKDTNVKAVKRIIETLNHREVQKPIISVIVDQLKKYKGLLNPNNIDNYVLSAMSSMIPTARFNLEKSKKSKVVGLVGPTGVGKTTCIAKLAIISKILHNLDVGLISIDTYRLGALDQLRIFAEVSNIDMLIAYDPAEMPGLIDSFKRKTLFLLIPREGVKKILRTL